MVAAHFALPFTNPVLVFALAMVIFLLAPMAVERFRVPGMIGLIVAGMLVGPNGFNLLEREPTIVLLGTVGLIYLMFLAGVEIDLQGFRRVRGRSVVFGAITFTVPLALGAGAAVLLGFDTPSAVLLGALLASHTLLAYPLAMRFGIAKNQAVTVAVGGTMIADTAALLTLAIVAAAHGGQLDAGFWIRLVVSLGVFVAVVTLGVPRLARWFFRHEPSGSTATFLFVLAALFAGAYLAEVAGVEAIVGAFLVGLALNRLIPAQGAITSRIHFVGEAFFIPFFLLWVGMLVDWRVLIGGGRAWLIMGTLLVTGVAAKWLAAGVTRRLFGYSDAEGWTIFGLSVPRASATLAIALIGNELGIFDNVVENGVILLMTVTCFLGPWAMERYGRRVALDEERRPVEPGSAPRRILVPMANPSTSTTLVDLAMLLREDDAREPLYALSVVPDEGGGAAEQVADAEKVVSRAVAHGAGADVPVVPLTRVDQNFANGIARAAVETRATAMVVGWDGRTSRQWVFGGVLDQLLEQTRQLVVVAKLGHPLNTTKRLVLVLPPGADHASGFDEAVRAVKRTASRLAADLAVLVVESAPEPYRTQIDAVKPDVPLTAVEAVPRWDALDDSLTDRLRRDDLVVVLTARRDTLTWHPRLERLPARLTHLIPESFLLIYPAEPGESASVARIPGLPRALARDRIVLGARAADPTKVLEALLERRFHENRRLRDVLHVLEDAPGGRAIAIAPGVVILHARLDWLSDPLLFLGVCSEGVRFPGTDQPAAVVFLVLSPTDQPAAHLAVLADVARVVALPSRVEALRSAGSVEEAVRVLTAPAGRIPGLG